MSVCWWLSRRFDEQHVQLKEQVESGVLGSPRIVQYNWRDPKTSADTVAAYIPPSGEPEEGHTVS